MNAKPKTEGSELDESSEIVRPRDAGGAHAGSGDPRATRPGVGPDHTLVDKSLRPSVLRWKSWEVSESFREYAERAARGEKLPPFEGSILAPPPKALPEPEEYARARREATVRRAPPPPWENPRSWFWSTWLWGSVGLTIAGGLFAASLWYTSPRDTLLWGSESSEAQLSTHVAPALPAPSERASSTPPAGTVGDRTVPTSNALPAAPASEASATTPAPRFPLERHDGTLRPPAPPAPLPTSAPAPANGGGAATSLGAPAAAVPAAARPPSSVAAATPATPRPTAATAAPPGSTPVEANAPSPGPASAEPTPPAPPADSPPASDPLWVDSPSF